jgi:hypothetical protein
MTARYVFDLAFENVSHVAVVSHPSLLKIPDDLEVSSTLSCPIEYFPILDHAEIPQDGKSSPTYQFMHE